MPDASLQTVPSSYTWGFAGSPIQIHLSIDVVRKLRKQIQESEKVTGALSACGLLTGETHQPGITTILDFKPLRALNATSADEAIDGATGEVVGFYRTAPIGSVSMPDDDKALAETHFRHPSSVFMIVETTESTIGAARFCFWSEDRVFDTPLMEFPLEASELASRESKRRLSRMATPARSLSAGLEDVASPVERERSESIAVTPPAGVREQKAPKPVTRQPFLMGWMAPALTTVLLASLLVAAYLYSRRGSNPQSNPQVVPQPPAASTELPPPLGLTVERRGKDLRISWNGNSDQILKADFGMLMIRGSAVSRDVPLTAEELRAGSVVYASAVDQLRFQLTVVAGKQVAREFLTVVLPQDAERLPARANLPGSPTGNASAGEAPRPLAPTSSVASREFRQFKDTRASGTVTQPGLDEPPPVSGATQVNSVNPSLLNRPPVSPNPPVSAPVSAAAAPAETPAQTPRQGLADSEATPPVPTKQFVPPMPALLRGIVWKPTSVDVNVSVDITGKVVKAEAVPKAGLHPLLREAAVQAALKWKFQPAQFDGHPVPANMILQFNFAPNR